MTESPDFEALFVQNVPVIDRATAVVARRHGFSPDDTKDLTSWVHLRIIEDNYAALRKFRGESSIATYLTVVVAMLVRDYRAQHWGRWRPSASARRLGDVAIRLETLVHRNGLPLQQASELLRTAGVTTQTDRQLSTLFAQLPSRRPLRPVEVGADSLAQVVTTSSADTPMELQQLDDEREKCRQLVEDALNALPTEDRLILRLRFWENVSVADIARGLRLEQKPLYRRLERLLVDLRRALTTAGLQPRRLQELLDEPGS
jgi:RNA polymerase sigma factor for flagellar operon FliA